MGGSKGAHWTGIFKETAAEENQEYRARDQSRREF